MSEENDIDKLIKDFENESRLDNKLCEYANMAIIGYEDHKPVVIKNAKVQYLKIHIESDENLKTKYSKLLTCDNQQKLNQVVLKYNIVQKILQATRKSFLESENFDDFIVEVQNFLECTDNNIKKISKFCALCMISAFDRKTLSQDQIGQVLDLVDEKLETKFDDPRDPLFALGAAGNIFDVLKDSAPEKFIQYVIDCIDFEKCKNNRENEYLFEIVCSLILHDPYSNDNFKQAIKNVLIDGKEYEEFRKKLSEVKDFGKYVADSLKKEDLYAFSVSQLQKRLSSEELAICFENGEFELKKIELINANDSKTELKFDNMTKIVAAVSKIATWIVFEICFVGDLICAFFAYRIKNLKNQEKKKIKSVCPTTQQNGYTIMHLQLTHLNLNINNGRCSCLDDQNGFDY